ncbi:conjugative transfer relaxase/helicase TraI domain-containing protein, partial (plasmid) [Enterobacter asburiae]|uniref:conjugative transfer relaxase/helicase TraI domain-containing protein n=1 Tax=Enterobacter asburiae TaxID=61645 RepID=UPI0032AFD741
ERSESREAAAGSQPEGSMAKYISPGRKYPQPHVALPAFDRNGRKAGVWLSALTSGDGQLKGLAGEGRVSLRALALDAVALPVSVDKDFCACCPGNV